MVHVVQRKQIFPWLQNEILFKVSPWKKIYDEALHSLHKFTKNVISEKRKEYEGSQPSPNTKNNRRVTFLGKKYFQKKEKLHDVLTIVIF